MTVAMLSKSPMVRHGWWLAIWLFVASVWILSACMAEAPPEDEEEPSAEGTSTFISNNNELVAIDNKPTVSTEPNLKVAFIGDTDTGSDFKDVLKLIRDEKAEMVMIQGDLSYSFFGGGASSWFPIIDNAINKAQPGSTAEVTIPYFVSKGNHDSDWGKYGPGLKQRMERWGVTSEHNDPSKQNYSVVYKGLKMVMVSDNETDSPSRADYVAQRFQNDDHIWRICSWHKNQKLSNVGGKGDEMGWVIYENCRAHGAIVAQGHSHTYSRSKTLTKDSNQTVDVNCNDPFSLCVGPGKHFFFDSSLGGRDQRSLSSSASKPHFASTFAADYGALFIEFNVDGDPRKAKGYFKTVGGVIIDPPASSGKTFFTITRPE
jgi:hypothetical protein